MARWQGSTRLLFTKVLTTFYRRMLLMVRPLDIPIPSLPPRIPVIFKKLTEPDLLAYCRFRPDQGLDALRANVSRGDTYVVAWHQGHIVHAGRLAIGRAYVPYLRQHLILQPRDVYSHESFTLPAYRGYGLAPARHVHVMYHYRQQGYERLLCLVAVENQASLRVMYKLGYQSVGMYSCLRFGLWQHNWQQTWGEASLYQLARTP